MNMCHLVCKLTNNKQGDYQLKQEAVKKQSEKREKWGTYNNLTGANFGDNTTFGDNALTSIGVQRHEHYNEPRRPSNSHEKGVNQPKRRRLLSPIKLGSLPQQHSHDIDSKGLQKL